MEQLEEIKRRVKGEDYPFTKAEAISAEAEGDKIGAGLFWGLVSATRRGSHGMAWDDVSYSANLLGISIPERIKNCRGLQAAQKWADFLRSL